MRYLLCLALLCACSTTQQAHTYKQSAFPSAPAFNPAWDAPHTVGQPGYVGEPEKVPRSPHKRVLPQTPSTRREAGIWAGDGPSVVHAGIYDKPWPVTPPDANYTRQAMGGFDAPDDLAAELPTETSKMILRCKWNVTQAFLRVPSYRRLSTFPSPVQQCANARLYLHCFDSNAKEYAALKDKGGVSSDPIMERVIRGLLAKAKVDRLRVCRGTQLPDEVADIVNDVNDAFDRMMETGDGKALGDLPKLELPKGPKH